MPNHLAVGIAKELLLNELKEYLVGNGGNLSIDNIISAYLWGDSSGKAPTGNELVDERWIRPSDARLDTDGKTHDFMNHGAGKHVKITDSKIVQAFFTKDITLTPREAPYTFAEIKDQLGISDDKETIVIDQTQRAINSDDYAHRAFITPKTTFTIDWSKVTFSIAADGSKTIHGLKIVPEDIIFDPLNNENTKALFEQIDPSKIGRPITIIFNADVLTADDITQITYGAVTADVERLKEEDQSITAKIRSAELKGVFSLMNEWEEFSFEEFYRDDAGRLVRYDGNHDGSTDDAMPNQDLFGYTLIGGDGKDTINGRERNDLLIGGVAGDTLKGNNGNDILVGGQIKTKTGDSNYGDNDASSDKLYGNNGEDTLYGGKGDDFLYGGDDEKGSNDKRTDTLYGGDGSDYLYGGAGHDILYGDGINNPLSREPDNGDVGDNGDHLYGGVGNDLLYGEGGTDTLEGGEGTDYLYGGSVVISTDVPPALFGGYENTVDSDQDGDYLYGGQNGDFLYGGNGDDFLYGGNDEKGTDDRNRDLLFGGVGNDYLYGGAGNDLLVGGYRQPTTGGKLNPFDGKDEEGIDHLYGGEGYDHVHGHGGGDYLYGNKGIDHLFGDGGDDYIYGGDDEIGTDDTSRDYLYGGEGNDYLYGGAGSDYLYSNSEKDDDGDQDTKNYLYGGINGDYLYGAAGEDYLYGGEGRDQLVGSAGKDILYGGTENTDGVDGEQDYLYGGVGFDTYYVDTEDRIKDIDGTGEVYLAGVLLGAGWREVDSFYKNMYITDTGFAYSFTYGGNSLVVYSLDDRANMLFIDGFKNGDLGIDLLVRETPSSTNALVANTSTSNPDGFDYTNVENLDNYIPPYQPDTSYII